MTWRAISDRPEWAEPLNVNVNQFNGVSGALAFIVISKCASPHPRSNSRSGDLIVK